MSDPRPRLAVFKFASCDGCQVSLFNLDERLLRLAEVYDISRFLELSSAERSGPYDVALVEGSVTTSQDVERIRRIREESRTLVTIGACATSGGIQALRNTADVSEWTSRVYPHPEWIETLATSTPISDHVKVDIELEGCPVNPEQVLQVLLTLARGTTPALPGESVCIECKRAGHVCVMVARGEPCMGPVTRAGCGAICPGMGRDCYACFGPAVDPNPAALVRQFEAAGLPREAAVRRLRQITGWRPEFRNLADELESEA